MIAIPKELEVLVSGLIPFCAEVQKSYLRDAGRYWNWEAGPLSISALFPGASMEFTRYTVGGKEEGWFLKMTYETADGKASKVFDQGNGKFSTDWTEAEKT